MEEVGEENSSRERLRAAAAAVEDVPGGPRGCRRQGQAQQAMELCARGARAPAVPRRHAPRAHPQLRPQWGTDELDEYSTEEEEMTQHRGGTSSLSTDEPIVSVLRTSPPFLLLGQCCSTCIS